jgi:hypothetical protein
MMKSLYRVSRDKSLGWPIGVLMVVFAGLAAAEPVDTGDDAITISTGARISLVPLTDETLTESGTITVQPRDNGSPDGALSEALPRHCLMSVQVTLGTGQAALQAGKMVCVTDDRRILELIPRARVQDLGECQQSGGSACARYVIDTAQTGTLVLESEGRLAPQPRNMEN